MGTKLFGNINVALVLGLAQFATTFLIAWLVLAARRREARPQGRGHQVPDGGRRMSPRTHHLATAAASASEHRPLIITLFGLFVVATLVITVWAGRQTKDAADFYAGGRQFTGFQNGLADLRRLHVRRVLPRHRRRHRPLRLRRLPLLHRLPGRLAGRPAAGRRTAAQLRPLHDGRRPRVPDAPAPGPHRRRHLHHRRLDLLPAGPDGRRGRPRLAAARHHQRRAARSPSSPSSAS